MADVALISVIASGTVGVLGAAGAVYAQRVTLAIDRHRRHEARLEDLRSVLDGAAQTAMTFNVPITAAEDRSFSSYAAEVDAVEREVEKHLARIGVRVGPESGVYSEYSRVHDAASALYQAIRRLPPNLKTSLIAVPPDELLGQILLAVTPTGEDPHEVLGRLQEPFEALAAALEGVERATNAFLTASAEQLAEQSQAGGPAIR